MWATSAIREEDRLDRVQALSVLRRALNMARAQWRHLVLALAFVIVSSIVTLAGPTLVRNAIDNGIRRNDSGVLDTSVVLYVAVTAIGYVVGRLQYIELNRAGEGFLRDLRMTVFDRMLRQSMAFFDSQKAGVLVSRMTADIESMGELIQFGLLQFVSAFLLLNFSVILLLFLSWQLALVTLLVLPVLIQASIRFQKQSNRAYLDVRERVGANLSTLQEGITGVRVIQAYGQEENRSRRFVASNRALFDSHMHSVKVSTWYFGLIEFAGIAATGAVIGFGGWLVHRGSISLGTVTAFVLLLANLFDPVQQLSQLYNTVQSSTAALHKLYGIIDAVPDVDEPTAPVGLPDRGDVVVDAVSFAYASPSPLVLRNVSLTVEDGERLALVGPTGAGKSTLAKLVARLYDPINVDGVEGTVSFGGVDLRRASLADLRRRIVVVPQEGFCFAGSIADNVRIASPGASENDIRTALRAIDSLERFESFENGLDTDVRERGSRLSAGERQLIALARAALVDPAVLVLDEATSSLDPGTEAAVERALERLMESRTVIVVAHRFSTIQRADRIGVIEGGRLVELGTHEELMSLGGRYFALATAWRETQPIADS